jgi:nicotinamidase/pyrazinamidase
MGAAFDDMETAPAPSGRSAFLVVDVQRDFCPGGALPASDGTAILPRLNVRLARAREQGIATYASRDWHPAVTSHFQAYGGTWPPHCVQGTAGARFHPDLVLPHDAIVVSKGMDPNHPGYSAFDGRTGAGISLADDLRGRGIEHLYVAGIATDYCVRQSVLDARREGFAVTVFTDAVAGIDVHPGDVARALDDMRRAGATLVSDADGFE